MKINHLVAGTLISRYKRFLADVNLVSSPGSIYEAGASSINSVVTAHCANTGAMTGLLQPDALVWLSYHDNPKRKLPYSWEIVGLCGPDGSRELASINTSRANALVREGIEQGVVTQLAGALAIRPEVKVDDARLDFMLTFDKGQQGSVDCYVEVKQVTLKEADGHGYFPDAVSKRGLKHLHALATLAQQGHRAVLLFCVAHTGIDVVRAAIHIDPSYASALQQAMAQGVEVLAYKCRIQVEGAEGLICLDHQVKVEA